MQSGFLELIGTSRNVKKQSACVFSGWF